MAIFIEWAIFQFNFSHIILALIFLFIFTCITQKLATKGPMVWPFLGIIPSIIPHFNEVYDWSTNALVKSDGSFYYKGLWLFGGFKGLITADPIKIEYMLKTKFNNFPKGKYFKERFQELLGDGIFNADDEKWKDQRRIAMLEMYTSRFMDYSMKIMQDLVHNKLLKVMEKLHCNNEVIDLQDLLLRFTFDNICMVTFGVEFSCLQHDELPTIPFAEAFEEATQCCLIRFLIPPLVWKFMRYFNVGKERKLKEAINVVHDFVETIIENRKAKFNEDQSQSYDLLSRLIVMDKNRGGDRNMIDKFLRDFCVSFILAGRDTSSVALVWLFWLIQKSPEIETKLVHEIVKIAREREKGKLLFEDFAFDAKELEKMVYLQATITESLRLYPSVPINFKEAKEDEIYPDGMKVHKGSRIFYHIYAMGRMEKIWGKDCNEFKPERWIRDGKFMWENQYNYVVFNGGPRFCVGKKFAYLQMKMIVASILLRYKVNIVKDQVIAPKVTTTLYMKHGLLVSFQPRTIDI